MARGDVCRLDRPARAAVFAAALGLAVAGGCVGEPPPVCQVMLECFDPEAVPDDAEDRYAACPDDPFYRHTDQTYPNWLATQKAFGPGGDCWAGGPNDVYYQACEDACRELVHDDCSRGDVGGAHQGDLCQPVLEARGETCADYAYDAGYTPRACTEP